MKYLFLFIFFLAGSYAKAQAIMTFERVFVQMDTLTQYQEGTIKLKFVNTGDKPLQIDKCTTTTPFDVCTWDKKAVAPGQTGFVTYKLRPEACGKWNKPVTITGKNGDVMTVHVKAFIRCREIPAPEVILDSN